MIRSNGSCGHFARYLLAGIIIAVAFAAAVHSQSSEQRVRPRTIVTTDPELDGSNSLVRFLLHSAEVETEGLHEDASFGGWGGRNAADTDVTGASPRDYATARWFELAQRDFAARLKWTVTPTFAAANHEPEVTISGPLNRTSAPGSIVRLVATASDPDRNALTVKWWQYTDAGTYRGMVSLSSPETLTTSFLVPADARPGQTIHALIQVTDNGTPALASFQRVIVTVAAQ